MSRPKSAPAAPLTDDPSSPGRGHAMAPAAPLPSRLALRLDELAASLGVSRRTIERERSAGRFPPPDLAIGRAPLWTPETIRRWIDSGGKAVS